MPDGLTHAIWHKRGWVLIVPASLLVMSTTSLPGGIGWLVGYGLGRWIDPDLDQIGITAAEGRMVNEIKIVGTVLVGYSSIYGAIFRRHHRSFITHFPFISTAIRLVYFFWWLYFAINVLYDWQILFMVGVFIGLSIADTIHYVLDKLFPDIGKF